MALLTQIAANFSSSTIVDFHNGFSFKAQDKLWRSKNILVLSGSAFPTHFLTLFKNQGHVRDASKYYLHDNQFALWIPNG